MVFFIWHLFYFIISYFYIFATRTPKIIATHSPQETIELGKCFAWQYNAHLLCLYGELGAGKTTFVRGLATGMGIKSLVKSPTFTYQRIYIGKQILYHFDCYRLEDFDHILLNDMSEALGQKNAVIAIEWAGKLDRFLPKRRVDIHFALKVSGIRIVTITIHD